MADLVIATCADCRHRHAGATLAYICVGCPCEARTFPTSEESTDDE